MAVTGRKELIWSETKTSKSYVVALALRKNNREYSSTQLLGDTQKGMSLVETLSCRSVRGRLYHTSFQESIAHLTRSQSAGR